MFDAIGGVEQSQLPDGAAAHHNYNGRIAKSGHYAGMYLGNPDIDFVKLAKSPSVKGEKVESAADFESALKRGIAATRDDKPYPVEVAMALVAGAGGSRRGMRRSTWRRSGSGACERMLSSAINRNRRSGIRNPLLYVRGFRNCFSIRATMRRSPRFQSGARSM